MVNLLSDSLPIYAIWVSRFDGEKFLCIMLAEIIVYNPMFLKEKMYTRKHAHIEYKAIKLGTRNFTVLKERTVGLRCHFIFW